MNELGDLYFMSVLKFTIVNITLFSASSCSEDLLLTSLGQDRGSFKALCKPLEYGGFCYKCINPVYYSAEGDWFSRWILETEESWVGWCENCSSYGPDVNPRSLFLGWCLYQFKSNLPLSLNLSLLLSQKYFVYFAPIILKDCKNNWFQCFGMFISTFHYGQFMFHSETPLRWNMLDFSFCFFTSSSGVLLFSLMLNLLVLENPFYLSKSYSLAMNLRTLWGDCIKPLLFLYCPLKKHLWLNGKGNYLILLSWRYWTQ